MFCGADIASRLKLLRLKAGHDDESSEMKSEHTEDSVDGARTTARIQQIACQFSADKMVASMMQVLDILNIGVSFVGADCRPAMCNTKMLSLLSESTCLRLTATGHLTSSDRRNAATIKELLVSAVLAERRLFSWHMLSAGSEQPTILLLFVSLESSALDIDDRPYAAVLAVDMRSDRAVSAKGLSALFCLTPAEADAVEAITSGVSTGEYAISKGISPNTVGAHLHNAMAKVKVSRQVDLVRHALSGLIWFSPETVNAIVEAVDAGNKQFQKSK